MPTRKTGIRHAEIVRLFAARLRELRMSRGLTQGELARQAVVTLSYISRLENGGAAPGIDLVGRLADALGTTVADLLPAEAPPDTADVLRQRARRLFDSIVPKADRETLQLLVPFLAKLAES
jgi:transcriptional regulator with XRE-family HTH domain